ncbi:MAG TPA: ABC transporter ATP-binding protein, partial [Candidatus Gemmiger faecigallinarum]|nr:ABC transporter ATP-binding protein [Candidatus Gemmiger faecigallinarum]
MLQIKQICKQYKTGSLVQQALDHVDLSFRDNEFVAILGPSGSGKTTLLNIIGGLDRYDSGDLIINGVSTKRYTDRDWDTYRNHTIGFIFQSYNLIPHQTILSNVELTLTVSGISREERRRRAIEALEKVGLGKHIHKHPNQLSGGQMQRVAIARALVNDPDVLLADEPTGALDSETSVQVMELLKEVARDRLVVMVTHNPELADAYATRIVRLSDGVIRADSDPYTPPQAEQEPVHKKWSRRSSMSFLTALSLSFQNLRSKKARTLLTAFAGSIGIIGIALILSLSTGVNQYIETVEEDTLSEYPLQIQSSGMDLTSMMAGMANRDDDAEADYQVNVIDMITQTFSKIGANDLAALKEYLESGESGIEAYTSAVEYSYNVTPQIYLWKDGDYRQVNPDNSFAPLGLGSSNTSNSMMSSMVSTDVFYQMPQDASLYQEQYTIQAGRWPQAYNECVLVLTANGSISDFLLYTLGLRDGDELDAMVQQFANEETVDVP